MEAPRKCLSPAPIQPQSPPGISNHHSDAGLLAREFDDALGIQESRTGRNILHHLVPLLTVDLQPLGRLRRHQ